MLRAFAYAFLIVFQLAIVRGNGYGNFADDDSGSQGVKSPQNSGPDTSISSLPQYESAGTSDQNYWWQQNNPFRRPPNHPGVEKGDSPSSRPQQPNPYQNQNKLHPTSHSRPNVFTPPQQPPSPFNSQPPSQQPNNPYSNPQSQYNPKPNQQFQQNSPAFGSPSQPNSRPFGTPSSSPQFPNNFPSSADEGCQLMNKADCHGAKKFPQQNQPSTDYEPPRPAPFNQPQPNKPVKGSPFGGKNPSVPQPPTNYRPPSYGAPEDEPSTSDFNPKPLDSNNQFSPSQDDIEAPSYGPISNDHGNGQPQNQFPSPSQPQKPQSNNPFSPPSQPQKPQSNNPFSSPSQPPKPQNNNPFSSPSQPQNPQDPYASPQQPQNNSPFSPPSQPQNNNPFSSPSRPQNPQGNNPYSPSNSPKNPNNYQQEPSQSSPQILSQAPQRPYQGPADNAYSPSQNTPQSNPADNGQYRPNPSPPQNFNNKPSQPQRPNNFVQPTNKPFKPANQPQTSGNSDYSDQLPYPGCPAAMLCVPESRCNVEGVIEERSIQLSQAEKDHRVALMACSHPMTGVVGVCCRDPNYKDPWPDMNGNGMPKKEHHHHPDKGNDFGGNTGNNPPFRQPPQQQSSPSGFQPNSNQRQPHQLQPQQYQPQREQYQPQRQQYQPQNQQYQPSQQQQQYQPQDQQRQPPKSFGGYPSDGKNDSNQLAHLTRQEHFPDCKVNEMCVERSRCHNGYIRDDSSALETLTINVRISTGSNKKCKADFNGKSFICCNRQPSNTIKPDLQFASTVIKESTLNAPKPIYQNNHHLQNTVAPPVSTLISGVGPLRNQEEINLRFRTSNFNPYISPATPFSSITRANVSGKHENAPVSSPISEAKNKTRVGNSDHSVFTFFKNEPSRVDNQKKGTTLKETQVKPDTSIGGLKKLVGDFKKVTNFSTTTPFSFNIRTTTTSSITSAQVNFTAEDEEDYIQSTTTTTTPKPYIHNGIPVPLNDHFKVHPPIGCIHKGSELHIESLVIPSKSYQLPSLDFNVGEEVVTEETTTKKTEISTTETVTTLLPLTAKSHSKTCPDGMACLAQHLCPSKETPRSNIRNLQCQQPKSSLPGVCCSGAGKNNNVRNNTFSEDHCGVRRPRVLVPSDKSDTFFGEFPWQIMILNSSDEFICSGALLDKRTIITTAKCIHQLTPRSIKVRVGEWNRQNNLQSEPTEDVPIQAVLVHPDFDSVALKNDIALLFTERNITYDYHIGRVCLPPTNENFDGRSCITTGWAASRKYANKSSYLKQKELLVLSQHNCQGRLQHNPNLTKRFVITRSNICARGDKQDVCESDVGDPLVCKSSSGEYQLVGLSSWTGTCGQINVPGIYVNISHHTNWITTHMNRPKNGNTSSHKE